MYISYTESRLSVFQAEPNSTHVVEAFAGQ